MIDFARSHRFNKRSGLSTLEAVATLAASTVGLVLGFALLGVNPTEWLHADPPSTAAAAAVSPDEDREAAELKQQLRQFRRDIERLQREAVENGAATEWTEIRVSPSQPRSRSAQPAAARNNTGRSTLAYWNELNRIMAKEETMRRTPSGGVTAANAGGFIAARRNAAEYAATAIRRLNTASVDPQVVQLAGDIAAWYERGASLSDQAAHLLNQASPTERRGQPGQTWSNAEKGHHASVAEINRRGDQLREAMTKKYGLPFPDLQ